MKEYVGILLAIISGFFAVVSAYFAWYLKRRTDDTARTLAGEKERRDELKQLYTDVFELIDNAVKEVMHFEGKSTAQDFSRISSRVHLLASDNVSDLYGATCDSLDTWKKLYVKSVPKTERIGEHTVTFIQAPDPTVKYKEPANDAFARLQDQFEKLVAQMKRELSVNDNGKMKSTTT
jgi:hypothetical protein